MFSSKKANRKHGIAYLQMLAATGPVVSNNAATGPVVVLAKTLETIV